MLIVLRFFSDTHLFPGERKGRAETSFFPPSGPNDFSFHDLRLLDAAGYAGRGLLLFPLRILCRQAKERVIARGFLLLFPPKPAAVPRIDQMLIVFTSSRLFY